MPGLYDRSANTEAMPNEKGCLWAYATHFRTISGGEFLSSSLSDHFSFSPSHPVPPFIVQSHQPVASDSLNDSIRVGVWWTRRHRP